MIGSISGNGSSSSIQARSGDRLTIENAAVAAEGAGRRGGAVVDNFKTAVMARIERFQKSGLNCDRSPEAAAALADSLAQAAAEVKDMMGQEAANAFMAKILKGIDENGFSLDGLGRSVGAALRDIGQAGAGYQLEKLAESFNRDLGPEQGQGRSTQSLSRAMNDFFASEAEKEAADPNAMGFDKRGYWTEVTVEGAESDGRFCRGTVESAQMALENSASFSIGHLSPDTVNDLVNFLRTEIGAEGAAAYLENQSGNLGFMDTMDKVIAMALEESADSGAAAKLETYLNGNVKGEINAMSAVNNNQFGYVEFEGWSFGQGGGQGGPASSTDFRSSWRYTNRDDATYIREGQADKNKSVSFGPKEGYVGLSPAELYRRLEEQSPNGELLDDIL